MSDPRLHFRKPLLTSPFHARTSALNKLNDWGPWGGYTTVLAYETRRWNIPRSATRRASMTCRRW